MYSIVDQFSAHQSKYWNIRTCALKFSAPLSKYCEYTAVRGYASYKVHFFGLLSHPLQIQHLNLTLTSYNFARRYLEILKLNCAVHFYSTRSGKKIKLGVTRNTHFFPKKKVFYRQKINHFWWSGAKCTFGWWDIENYGKFRCPSQSSEGHRCWNILFNKITVLTSYKIFLYEVLFLGQTQSPISPILEHNLVHSQYWILLWPWPNSLAQHPGNKTAIK
jgi:hypothetical protein